MKKLKMIISVIICALILSGCSPKNDPASDDTSQTPEHTGAGESSIFTEASAPSAEATIPTNPSSSDMQPQQTEWKCIHYSSYISDQTWKRWYGEGVSQWEHGNLYAVEKHSQKSVWLYDASLIAEFITGGLQIREATDAERQKGKYVYYILKAEPDKVYRMDYQGTVRDELVYDFDAPIATTCDFEVTFDSFGQDVLVVQYGNQIMVVDTVTKICEVVTENEYMDDLAGVSYSENGELIIVYNIMILDNAGVAYTVRQYYNVTMGETAGHYIW